MNTWKRSSNALDACWRPVSWRLLREFSHHSFQNCTKPWHTVMSDDQLYFSEFHIRLKHLAGSRLHRSALWAPSNPHASYSAYSMGQGPGWVLIHPRPIWCLRRVLKPKCLLSWIHLESWEEVKTSFVAVINVDFCYTTEALGQFFPNEATLCCLKTWLELD